MGKKSNRKHHNGKGNANSPSKRDEDAVSDGQHKSRSKSKSQQLAESSGGSFSYLKEQTTFNNFHLQETYEGSTAPEAEDQQRLRQLISQAGKASIRYPTETYQEDLDTLHTIVLQLAQRNQKLQRALFFSFILLGLPWILFAGFIVLGLLDEESTCYREDKHWITRVAGVFVRTCVLGEVDTEPAFVLQ
eukprot:m.80529 g.80529  ORF g.80529 m.80529 type:complete len:190 (+) comp14212_c2_seq2:127-696(+)